MNVCVVLGLGLVGCKRLGHKRIMQRQRLCAVQGARCSIYSAVYAIKSAGCGAE